MTDQFALRHIPFSRKLAAVPAIAAVVLAVLGVTMRANSRAQVARLDGVVETELHAITEISGAALSLRAANASLYYMLTAVASGASAAAATESGTADILTEVDAAKARLEVYLAGAAPADRERLDSAVAHLAKYREAAEFVGSMLEIDFASAVSFVEPFQENYRNLNATMAAIVNEHVAASEEAASRARQEGQAAIRTMLILVLASLVALIALAYVITRATVESIQDIAGATLRLAQGDHSEDIERLERRDELGAISRSLITFRQNAIESAHLQEEQRRAEEARREEERRHEEEQRRRDAEQQAAIRERRRQEMLALADAFERSVLQVASAVSSASTEMEELARVMSTEAESAQAKSRVATTAADEALTHTQTVAGAAQQLYASLRATTEQVSSSSDLARNAVLEASGVNDRVKILRDAARTVSGVVTVINTIASQTRLLALNATIEAGIAGEAGAGFAVVAGEVKALANQTAQATEEIEQEILAMQDASQSAEKAIGDILQLITTVEHHVSSIATAVREQDSATEEIARTVESLSGQAHSVSTTITSMRESTETTQTVAGRVLDAARHLNVQSGTLTSEVNRLLADIRAA